MKRFLAITAFLAGCPGMALAAASCTTSATTVALGTVNPFGSPVTYNGTITVACTGGASNATYTIALSTGGSGSYSPRQMKNGASTLNYNLYTSSAYSTIWGNGAGGSVTVTGMDTKKTSTFTVYGMVPTPQGITPASYSDTITVTVTY